MATIQPVTISSSIAVPTSDLIWNKQELLADAKATSNIILFGDYVRIDTCTNCITYRQEYFDNGVRNGKPVAIKKSFTFYVINEGMQDEQAFYFNAPPESDFTALGVVSEYIPVGE